MPYSVMAIVQIIDHQKLLRKRIRTKKCSYYWK